MNLYPRVQPFQYDMIFRRTPMDKKIGLMLASTAAVLFAAGSVSTTYASGDLTLAKKEMVKCKGANSCKGQSDCKMPGNSCKGMNSCKGKGLKMVESKDECKKMDGTVVE